MQPAGMTDAQLQANLEKQRQQAITEMQANPTAVAERMRAAGASEDDIASVFQRAGVSYPRVDVGTIRTRLPEVPIVAERPASLTRDPSGRLVHSEIPIRSRTGTTTLPGGKIPPKAKAAAPQVASDDKILQQNLKPRRK